MRWWKARSSRRELFYKRHRRMSVEALEVRTLLSGTNYEAGHILVQFKGNATPEQVAGTTVSDQVGQSVGLHIVELAEGMSVEQAVAAYSQLSTVEFAQPDYILDLQRTPNDPSYNFLWGQHNVGQQGGRIDADIDAPEAWDITTGSSSVIVAVIDTGVDYTHPDLAANIWRNTREIAGNGVDDDANGFVDDTRGWDFFDDDNDPMDIDDHGTHVSGTIGAVGNNNIGVVGVAWNVQIMPVRFLGPAGGSTADAISSIDYAVANGAKILNNSWGGGGFSLPLQNAIVRARNAGVIFVAAAGNSSSDNDIVAAYPTNYPVDNVVSVAASDRNDVLSSFSNYGDTNVDLAAPGSEIYSTLPGNTYGFFDGTSMATPQVSGAMALVWSQYPSFTYRQVIDQILNNVDVKPSLQNFVSTGGRLNVNRALGVVTPPASQLGPKVVSSTWNLPAGFATVTFNQAVNQATFTPVDVKLVGPDRNTIPISSISQISPTQYAIVFAPKSAAAFPGSFKLTVGPNITNLAGKVMDQNGNGRLGEATADQFVATTTQGVTTGTQIVNLTGPRSILDGRTLSLPMTLSRVAQVNTVTVTVNATHLRVADLSFNLVSPTGTRVPVTYGVLPTGVVVGSFAGQNLKGNWKLEIIDSFTGFQGTFNSATITFNYQLLPPSALAVEPGFDIATPPVTSELLPEFLAASAIVVDGAPQFPATPNVLGNDLGSRLFVTSEAAGSSSGDIVIDAATNPLDLTRRLLLIPQNLEAPQTTDVSESLDETTVESIDAAFADEEDELVVCG